MHYNGHFNVRPSYKCFEVTLKSANYHQPLFRKRARGEERKPDSKLERGWTNWIITPLDQAYKFVVFTCNTCGAGDNSTNKAAASHRTTSSGDDIIRLYTHCTKQLAFGIVLRMDFWWNSTNDSHSQSQRRELHWSFWYVSQCSTIVLKITSTLRRVFYFWSRAKESLEFSLSTKTKVPERKP